MGTSEKWLIYVAERCIFGKRLMAKLKAVEVDACDEVAEYHISAKDQQTTTFEN